MVTNPHCTDDWSVAQRWRALTAASFTSMANAYNFELAVEALSQSILSNVKAFYHLPSEAIAQLYYSVTTTLHDIYNAGFDLAVMIKRDVVSARLAVNINNQLYYDSDKVESPWSGTGNHQGEEVIGNYAFGLTKQTKSGAVLVLMKPKVFTAQILRKISSSNT